MTNKYTTPTSGAADLRATFSEMLVDLPNTEPFTLFKAGFDAALATGQATAAPAQADTQLAPHSEPWYGHQFKEVRRGYWQCSCGKAIAEAVPSASKDSYPPLPNRYAYDDDGVEMFTADHMRAYVDSDRAARAQADSQPALDRDRIREIFMEHGFTVKEGQTDLKQYVYDAADALLRAARAPADSDLITIRKPTTSAEMLWLLKLAHLISDVAKTLEESFAPAQPAAEASRFGSPELQAMIIARCVEKDQAGKPVACK